MKLHLQVEYRTVRIDANTTAFEVFFIGGRDRGDQMLLMMIMVNMMVILMMMLMLTFDTL